MKMQHKLILIFSAIFIASCSWLDIEPEGEATDKKLFETGDGYRSVLSGVYKAMSSANLYGVELQFGTIDCISQQYLWGWNYYVQNKSKYEEVAAFQYDNKDVKSTIESIWAEGYNVIANANNLIQNIEKEPESKFEHGELEKKMIIGEAYACRALMHFDLFRLFAPAPIENEGGKYLPYVDYYPNIQPESIDSEEFLNKVIKDLETAQKYTMTFDTTALGGSVSASYRARFNSELEYGTEGYQNEKSIDDFLLGRGYRLTYYSITALLARVHHYMNNFDQSYKYAKQVLEAKAVRKDGSTIDMFTTEDFNEITAVGYKGYDGITDLKIKSTLLFALYNEEAYNDYNLESYFRKKVSDMNVGSWFIIDLDNQEIFKRVSDGFDEFNSDYRGKFLLFPPEYQGFWEPRYISAKGYCSDDELIRKQNTQILPIMRTTELRYIIAECEARNSKFTEAYDILNRLRQNRGLYEPLEVKSTLDDFVDDMIRDAQREYISEGQLFYLYKRLGAEVKIGREKRKMTKAEYMFPIPINQSM
jgi:SusD family.